MKKICENCLWWNEINKEIMEKSELTYNSAFYGHCRKLGEPSEISRAWIGFYNRRKKYYKSNINAELITYYDFGCNLWEERAKKKKFKVEWYE